MHFENEAIVHAPGPMPWLLRALLLLAGLLCLLGPALLFQRAILAPDVPVFLQLFGAAALIGFAIAGVMALREATAPRHDLRFDPLSGVLSVTTHAPLRHSTARYPLRALGPPRVERIGRSDSSDDYALHIPVAGRAPITLWYIESEEEAELWCRRIEALRLAAQ